MSEVPPNLRYTKSHEWAEELDDGSVRVGITDHAQDLLGDMVYVELPEVNNVVNSGEECAVVESVKAASDVYSPMSGEIIESNEILTDKPETVNQDPYGQGWLFRLNPSDVNEINELLDAESYVSLADSEED